MSANVYKLPPKKLYKAAGIGEESKHCSAPGSQVQTDIFFSLATWQEKEAFQWLPPWAAGCALEPWALLARLPWPGRAGMLGGGCGESMHRAQVNEISCWSSRVPRQDSQELLCWKGVQAMPGSAQGCSSLAQGEHPARWAPPASTAALELGPCRARGAPAPSGM